MRIPSTPLHEIAAIIHAEYIGNKDHVITGFNEIHRVEPGDVVFVDHPKYYNKALHSAASTILINERVDCPEGKALIIHPEPFTAFNELTAHFQPKQYSLKPISDTARIGKTSLIMPGVYVGNHVTIGEHCIIHPNVVIYDHTVIGDHVTIHAGSVIGSDAFYFKKRASGFEQLQSCGNVIIEDHVSLGSNVTIDRGVTHVTRIGKGSILDNMVHIAHDVTIGEMCLFAAQVAIAGCCTIGNRVTMWGQVGISSGITIEDNVVVQAQSGVGENLKQGKIYFGSPAYEAREKMKEVFAAKQLPSLIHKLYDK
ncbi:MAG: UDP-3-O-(3-hydroxymyristoyl)glucosamine N-acyltransferase [Bacteroidetes bacterium]|nr:UDP-3-O-(3-hydroxymyristoyl)glucosamine N-acyltransferase [Bacteroidota bacterium]